MVLRTNFKVFKVVSSIKIFFSKIGNFLTFFAYPGSQISWKRTNYLFERYRPEICRVANIHKWCCELKRRFVVLRTQILEKWTVLKDTGLLSSERILRRFGSFRAKKIFFQKLEIFWLFLHIRGHRFLEKWPTSFLRDTGLKFVVWTAQMVLQTNFKAFWVVSSEKKFFEKLEIFWLFLHIRGHRFLEKWPTSFLRDTGLKFVVDCTNGVANEF